MKIQTGSVVIADAGRDSGSYFIVLDCEDKYCFIADGKTRKLAKPKRKNIKHIRLTDSMIDINDITDKKLRVLLREMRKD